VFVFSRFHWFKKKKHKQLTGLLPLIFSCPRQRELIFHQLLCNAVWGFVSEKLKIHPQQGQINAATLHKRGEVISINEVIAISDVIFSPAK